MWAFDSGNAGAFGDVLEESPLFARNASDEFRGYVIGGLAQEHVGEWRHDVHAYTLAADTWNQRQSLPYNPGEGNTSPRPGVAAGGLGYVSLWRYEERVRQTIAYNELSDSWTVRDKFPDDATPQHTGQGTRVQERFYIFDVFPIRGDELYTWSFNTVTRGWRREKERPPFDDGRLQRHYLACTIHGKCYHYKSGATPQHRSVSLTYEYDPVRDTWEIKTPATLGVEGAAGKQLDGEAYAHGGARKAWNPPAPPVWIVTRLAESYLPSTDTWRVRRTLLLAQRWLHRAFVIPDAGPSLVITGGTEDIAELRDFLVETVQFHSKKDVWISKQDIPGNRIRHESWAL